MQPAGASLLKLPQELRFAIYLQRGLIQSTRPQSTLASSTDGREVELEDILHKARTASSTHHSQSSERPQNARSPHHQANAEVFNAKLNEPKPPPGEWRGIAHKRLDLNGETQGPLRNTGVVAKLLEVERRKGAATRKNEANRLRNERRQQRRAERRAGGTGMGATTVWETHDPIQPDAAEGHSVEKEVIKTAPAEKEMISPAPTARRAKRYEYIARMRARKKERKRVLKAQALLDGEEQGQGTSPAIGELHVALSHPPEAQECDERTPAMLANDANSCVTIAERHSGLSGAPLPVTHSREVPPANILTEAQAKRWLRHGKELQKRAAQREQRLKQPQTGETQRAAYDQRIRKIHAYDVEARLKLRAHKSEGNSKLDRLAAYRWRLGRTPKTRHNMPSYGKSVNAALSRKAGQSHTKHHSPRRTVSARRLSSRSQSPHVSNKFTRKKRLVNRKPSSFGRLQLPRVRRQPVSPTTQLSNEQTPEYQSYLNRLSASGVLDKAFAGLPNIKKLRSEHSNDTVFVSKLEKQKLDVSRLLQDVDSTLKSWYGKPSSSFDSKTSSGAVKTPKQRMTMSPQSRSMATKAGPSPGPSNEKQDQGQKPDQEPVKVAENSGKSTEDKPKKKTIAEIDRELQQKMAGHAGDGGEAGVEYENGEPVAMKRSVKNNMFRYI